MALIIAPALYSLQLQLRTLIAKINMEVKLETENLVTIRVKSNSVLWLVKGKEANIDQQLFDVRHSQADGDFIELTGLFDEEESKLLKEISKKSSREQEDLIKRVSAFDWLDEIPCSTIAGVSCFIQHSLYYPFYIIETPLGILTPPPKG